jgi:aminoglycoside/choline kinase family phosphotransferase
VSVNLPASAEDLTPALLTSLVSARHPAVVVEAVEVLQTKSYGEEMVSTSARAVLQLHYRETAPSGLPSRVVVKMSRGVDTIMAPFYRNEVAFYQNIRDALAIEAPRVLGAAFDPESLRFALVLEDLTARGARFPNVTQPVALADVEGLIDTQAALHAAFWESPRFRGDLAAVETHLHGGVARLMNELAPAYIQHEIDNVAFKREIVQRLRTTGPELLAGVQALQRHQSRLPQTLLHGDSHLGNTYLLAQHRGGLLDWQLCVRGHCLHDVSYLLATSLPVESRRQHERDLLSRYLERLREHGVRQPPRFEIAWCEYRRAMIWGVYIGWLTTPVVNYGWEINVVNHLRLMTAYEDLDTASLVAEVR